PLKQLKNYYTAYYLPYRGAKAWGKYEKLVEGSQGRVDNDRVHLLKRYHTINSESLILDVGCGKPTFLKKCAETFNCKTWGIDFSSEGWELQKEFFEGIQLQVAEVRDIPTTVKVDVITMWHYLEHDYFPFENLKHIKEISKKETTLIIEVPN